MLHVVLRDLDHRGQKLHICHIQLGQLPGGVLRLASRLRHPIRRDAMTFWSVLRPLSGDQWMVEAFSMCLCG